MNDDFYIVDLKWDTQYFNIAAGRLDLLNSVPYEHYDDIKKRIKKFEFLTIINYNNDSKNNELVKYIGDAFLSDINVQFVKKVKKNNKTANDKRCTIKSNKVFNSDIMNISENSFKISRFSNDKNINSFKASHVYYEWTKNSFNKENKYFLTYTEKNKCIGFMIFHIDKNSIIIELFATDLNNTMRGVGKTLMAELENFALERNIERIIVGTQANNYKATRFYQNNGFQYFECRSVYHVWRNK